MSSLKSGSRVKWWGWGDESVRFDLSRHPGVGELLRSRLGVAATAPRPDFDLARVELPAVGLAPAALAAFGSALGGGGVSLTPEDRLHHAAGRSYPDLLRLRSGRLPLAPDLVLYPESEAQVVAAVELAARHGVALVPFGGGTSVVGGVEPLRGTHAGVVVLDTKRLDRLISVDEWSRTATVQAGILGPALERALGERGYTLGHFPQSFEYSTLGGWIAARSSGQNSLRYGGIERLVVACRMVTPTGVVVTQACPRRADGPDLREVVLGSEGVLGVVTEAVLRIGPKPRQQLYYTLGFPTFEAAQTAARELAQDGPRPAMVRVSDEDETEAFWMMSQWRPDTAGAARLALVEKYLQLRGLTPPRMALMMIGCEGDAPDCAADRRAILRRVRAHGAVDLGADPGRRWLRDRFHLPYLRDELLDQGVMIDTFETATSWSNHLELHRAVKAAVAAALDRQGTPGLVLAHISHLYHDGASLYFTFIAPQRRGAELEQWQAVKLAANEAVVAGGGVISHHHGVGVDHRTHTGWTPPARALLGALKQASDPAGVMNPGKLL